MVASANPDKVAEIAAILGSAVVLLPRPPEVPEVVEDADTLEGNARLKATAIAAASGRPALADDTRGSRSTPSTARPASSRPGSPAGDATYADNVTKLLDELAQAGRPSTPQHGPLPDRGSGALARRVARSMAEGAVQGTIAPEAPAVRVGSGTTRVFVPDTDDGLPGARSPSPR